MLIPRSPLFDGLFPSAKKHRCAKCGKGVDAAAKFCPACGVVIVAGAAPLTVTLELWPDELRGRASLTENGKTRDVEVATPVLRMILGAVNAYRPRT